MALTAAISGEKMKMDFKYGDITDANQELPHLKKTAVYIPEKNTNNSNSSTKISILVVTIFTLSSVSLLINNSISPIKTQIAAINEEISKNNNRKGSLFQRMILFGMRKARRWPKNSIINPQWNGTEPQNNFLPSKNCDDKDDTLNFCDLYLEIVPIKNTTKAMYGKAIKKKLLNVSIFN